MNIVDGPLGWYGELAPSAEITMRLAYAGLLFFQLLWTIPNARFYYVSRRFGGYMHSTPFADRWHNPATAWLVIGLWLASAVGLMFNETALAAAAVNFTLARYFFVSTRWKSILRGMGAPGHMNHYLAAFMLFLTFSERFDVNGVLHTLTVATFRIDFAVIMIAAGVYKIVAGYTKNRGFQFGLVNPWWGQPNRIARNIPPDHPIYFLANQLAYATEIICGVAFFAPPIAPFAAIALGGSFIVIGRLIRLSLLAEMVAACCLIYIWPQDLVATLLAKIVHLPLPTPIAPGWAVPIIIVASAGLALYMIVLPLAYAGMAVNLYGKRRLTPWLQSALDAWTRFFGLILWRVFTEDVVNFYCDLYSENELGRSAILVDGKPALDRMRYNHVAEYICLASLFTTLKYYPKDFELFKERLLTYASSHHLQKDTSLVFRYTYIGNDAGAFAFTPCAEFIANPARGTVTETSLDATIDVRVPRPGSPVKASDSPGSYAPAHVQ